MVLLYILQNLLISGGNMQYICALCGYVYKSEKGDVDNGVPAGTDFEDISEEWVCPLCGASKEDFETVVDEDIDGEDEF